MFVRKYLFGGTAVYYVESPIEGHDGKTTVGFAAYPSDIPIDPEHLFCDSLVQAAFTGDDGLIDYTRGVTMRNRAGTVLHVLSQSADEKGVVTRLTDGRGNRYAHILGYSAQTGVFSVRVEYENASAETRTLEMLENISLSGIASPSAKGVSAAGLRLHRMTSAWSRECRVKTDDFTDLGLDMSWARYGVKVEKWGQTGSMPNRGYYPFAAIEAPEAGIVWGFTTEAPFSWQMEVYEEKETCAFSCGQGDYEFAHWRKNIPAGGTYSSPTAFFTVKKGGLNDVCNALVHEQAARLDLPESEKDMPVLFNEYCTTWGCPSAENIAAILQAIRSFDIGYFVIDCGWYKPDDKGWNNAIGDWKESAALFPDGIGTVCDAIRAAGMIPGIWFEFENAGRDSEVFSRNELFLTRDGIVITNKNRRFFDLRKEEVRRYIASHMVDLLVKNGFGYLKIDYNDAYGIGCDGAESLGEGGRQVAQESLRWLDRLREAVPGIVIENCASGGSRIEPGRMSKVSMCSFSDAHECAEIPFVAANVSRVIPARQSQIWAVLRRDESPSRTVYSLCAAMMGRICLSGDVTELSDGQRALIREGLDFYRAVKDIVAEGDIVKIDCDIASYRSACGRQIYEKEYKSRKLVLVHALNAHEIRVPAAQCRLLRAYTDQEYRMCGGEIVIAAQENGCGAPCRAAAFLLEKEEESGSGD